MKETISPPLWIVATIIILLLRLNLQADQDHPSIDFVETKVVDGFFIGVTDEFGHTNTSPDLKLCFSIWTTNKTWAPNNLHAVFPTQPEYAYQVELFDTNGIAVPKTDVGKKVGTRFLDFDINSFVLRSTGPDKTNGVDSQRILVSEKVWPYEMLTIFRPSDLFKIEKPGDYILQIRFQILTFRRTGPNRGDNTNDLIRFPPFNYPLVKQ